MPHVDKTCTTHYACDCISAELAALRAENERLKEYRRVAHTLLGQRTARIAELEAALSAQCLRCRQETASKAMGGITPCDGWESHTCAAAALEKGK